MKDCPFCELPKTRVLRENHHARVVLSDPRKVPGHTLVIPKRHAAEPWDLTGEEIKGVFELIWEVEQKLVGQLGEGCDIRQNYRPFVPDSDLKVSHTHFHVIPRSKDDYIYTVSEQFESELWAELDAVERQAVSKLLD